MNNGSKSNRTISVSVSMCALRRSPHVPSQGVVGKSRLHLPSSYTWNMCLSFYIQPRTWNPKSNTLTGGRFALVFMSSYLAKRLRPTDEQTGVFLAFSLSLCFSRNQPWNRDLSWGVKDKPTSMFLAYYLFTYRFIDGGWRQEAAWFVSSSYYLFQLAYYSTKTITYYDTTRRRPCRRRGLAKYHRVFIKFEFRLCSWVSPATRSVESDLRDCSGLFLATLKTLLFFSCLPWKWFTS